MIYGENHTHDFIAVDLKAATFASIEDRGHAVSFEILCTPLFDGTRHVHTVFEVKS